MVDRWADSQKTRARGRTVAALTLGPLLLVAALWLPWPHVLIPTVGAVAALALLDRRQLSALTNKWLWLALTIAIVLPVWLFGTPGDRSTQYAGRHWAALAAGVTMAARVLTTIAVMLLVGGCLAPSAVGRVIGRFAGRELGMASAIGINLLPAVLEILRRTTLALRLRGGFRRRRLANLKRLATAVGVQTIRLTEDVAEALLLAQGELSESDEDQTTPDGDSA